MREEIKLGIEQLGDVIYVTIVFPSFSVINLLRWIFTKTIVCDTIQELVYKIDLTKIKNNHDQRTTKTIQKSN